MDLVVRIYALAGRMPASELYGLRAQMQRAAVSVPANIAEGQGRDHLGDYLRHLSIAKGSLTELETHLEIARRLGYLGESDTAQVLQECDEIGKMLGALSRRLRKQANT